MLRHYFEAGVQPATKFICLAEARVHETKTRNNLSFSLAWYVLFNKQIKLGNESLFVKLVPRFDLNHKLSVCSNFNAAAERIIPHLMHACRSDSFISECKPANATAVC